MKLGVCGDRCDACPRYIATATDDADLFERIMRSYVKTGLREESTLLESLKCRGCSPENTCACSFVRDCAAEKEVVNCGECPIYPCEKINEVFQKTEAARGKFAEVCTKEEIALFEPAFFRKREHLDEVKRKRKT